MSHAAAYASEQIAAMRVAAPARYELARRVSIAARIDQPFLRSVRLALVPQAKASDETELWFGPLVENFNAEGFVLIPEVAGQLRDTLRGETELIGMIHQLLENSHGGMAPVVQLEERLIAEALAGRPLDSLERLLVPAMRGLMNPRRHALSRWVRRALPGLPQEVQGLRVAEALQERALVISEVPGAAFVDVGADWRQAVGVKSGHEVDVWLCMSSGTLEISLDPDNREFAFPLRVAEATPHLVQVAWRSNSREHTRLLRLLRGKPARLSGIQGPVSVRFADGQRYRVEPDDPHAVPADYRYRLAKVAVFWPGGEAAELCRRLDAQHLWMTRSLQPAFSLRLEGSNRVSPGDPQAREVALWPHVDKGSPPEALLHQASAVLIARDLDGDEPVDVQALLEDIRRIFEERGIGDPPIVFVGMPEGHHHLDIQPTHAALLGLAAAYQAHYEPHGENIGGIHRSLGEVIDWGHGVAGYADEKLFEKHRQSLPWFEGEGFPALPLEELESRFAGNLDDPYAPQLNRLLDAGERLGLLRRIGATVEEAGWVVPAGTVQDACAGLLNALRYGKYRLAVIEREMAGQLLGEQVAGIEMPTKILADALLHHLEQTAVIFSFVARESRSYVCVPALVTGTAQWDGSEFKSVSKIAWNGPSGRVLQKLVCRLSVEEEIAGIDVYRSVRGERPAASLVAVVNARSGLQARVIQPRWEESVIHLSTRNTDSHRDEDELIALVNRLMPDCVGGAEIQVDRLADMQQSVDPSVPRPAVGIRQDRRRVRPLDTFRDALPDGSFGPDMVVIPPGRFLMGSPEGEEGRKENEGPQHPVTIPYAYAVAKYPVTLGEFKRFAEATDYKPADTGVSDKLDFRRWLYPEVEQTDQHPVVLVSWHDAVAYAKWLSHQTGQHYRLPSESEWEFSARAGITSADGFATGSGLETNIDAGRGTVAVGGLPGNRWGLHGMSRGVAEWCADCWHPNYEMAPEDGSARGDDDGADCERRVFRGGPRTDSRQDLRPARRGSDLPAHRANGLGFRLARESFPPRAQRERDTVFVSYAHEDKRWVREIGVYLRALASSLSFELWDDTRIAAGAVWREEISAALSRSRVAVLVLTPEYMASEYLSNDELPALLDAAEAGGVTILCVYASDVRLVGTAKALSGYQFVNAPDAPLSGLNQAERDKVYVALAEELEKALTTK